LGLEVSVLGPEETERMGEGETERSVFSSSPILSVSPSSSSLRSQASRLSQTPLAAKMGERI
jgi:hypothetical protein